MALVFFAKVKKTAVVSCKKRQHAEGLCKNKADRFSGWLFVLSVLVPAPRAVFHHGGTRASVGRCLPPACPTASFRRVPHPPRLSGAATAITATGHVLPNKTVVSFQVGLDLKSRNVETLLKRIFSVIFQVEPDLKG
jgi:hypothetical protein